MLFIHVHVHVYIIYTYVYMSLEISFNMYKHRCYIHSLCMYVYLYCLPYVLEHPPISMAIFFWKFFGEIHFQNFAQNNSPADIVSANVFPFMKSHVDLT